MNVLRRLFPVFVFTLVLGLATVTDANAQSEEELNDNECIRSCVVKIGACHQICDTEVTTEVLKDNCHQSCSDALTLCIFDCIERVTKPDE
ncbi:MAG: hypothetical protein AB7G75_05850 [Candidatus Binatia bacterium]